MQFMGLLDICLDIQLFGLHRSHLKAKTALVSKNACNIWANLRKTHAPRFQTRGTNGIVTTLGLNLNPYLGPLQPTDLIFGLIAETMQSIAQSSIEIHWLKLMPSVAFCGNGD